jgi:predicted transcriptional regulator
MDTTITLRIDEAMAKKLDDLKEKHSVNISDFVRKAIADRLERAPVVGADKPIE